MLAAAECAEDANTPPPPELAMAWRVERWGSAAVWQGEIPMRLVRRMTAAANVYSAFMSYASGKTSIAQWATRNPIYFKIVTDVRTMRANNGATG